VNLHRTLVMAIPAAVALAGGLLAAYWNPSRSARSLIQHFAAGVILAALAVEVFPEIGRGHIPAWVLVTSFALGSLFMYALKVWTTRMEAHEGAAGSSIETGLVLATFVDVAVDGFMIGAGFSASGETGTILALGLSVELLFLGLALASDAIRGWRIVALSAGIGATVMLCALIGSVLLAGTSHAVIGGALAFSAAALLYLVTDELLVEAHEVPETPTSTLVLFSGFLVFWCIQLMGVG
jgi:zinc transporter, ZIP family